MPTRVAGFSFKPFNLEISCKSFLSQGIGCIIQTFFSCPSIGKCRDIKPRPWLYVSTFAYAGTGEECLDNAADALREEGFTRDFEVKRFKGKSRNAGGHVDGKLRNYPVVAKIECDQSLGVTGLAVTGIDNKLTYEKYSDLFDKSW